MVDGLVGHTKMRTKKMWKRGDSGNGAITLGKSSPNLGGKEV